MIEGHEM